MNQWQVGNVKITRVIEMEVAGGTKFILPQATPEKIIEMPWLIPHFADETGFVPLLDQTSALKGVPLITHLGGEILFDRQLL